MSKDALQAVRAALANRDVGLFVEEPVRQHALAQFTSALCEMGHFFPLVGCELVQALHSSLGQSVRIDHPLRVVVVLFDVGGQRLHVALVLLSRSQRAD